jgi:sugar transferase (PEP-CTERM/EpsH1 system associated)
MHVVHCLGTHGRTGGMEYGVIKLANGGDPTRVLTAVCSTRTADTAIRGLLEPTVPYYECAGRRGNDPGVVRSLYRVFRQFRPHVVHTHGWGTLLEGMAAARLARVPRLVHGEHGTLQRRAYQRWIQRVAWQRADEVLTVSSRLADRLARDVGVPRTRLRTIRNGVDLERFDPHHRESVRRDLGIEDDVVVFGTVGRLVPVKDHATLLRAFAEAVRGYPRTMLVVAGDGPLREALQRQAGDLGVADRVRFLGHRADVERILAAFDVFVLSSVSEGMSNTILEAMATELPVIATAVGGADELVVEGETGMLIPAGDPERLAGAMASLASNGARRRSMGGAARQRARRDFSLSRMIAEYEQLYLDLAGTGRAAAALPELVSERAAASSATGDRL